MAVQIEEEIRGTASYDVVVTERYVELSNGTNRFRAFLDEDGWQELQMVVTEVCVQHGLV